jgi:two-component system nitrate/nitrite response regulator NarL
MGMSPELTSVHFSNITTMSIPRSQQRGRKKQIRILLVDDHPIVLEGVDRRLRESDRYTLVGTATEGVDAVQQATTLRPDIALLDITLPRMNGLQALKIISKDVPSTRVVIFTMHDNKEYLRECLSLGARGYVLKTSSPDTLIQVLESVHGGHVAIDSQCIRPFSTTQEFLRWTRRSSDPIQNTVEPGMATQLPQVGNRQHGLTLREEEILQLIVAGCTMQEIAQTLSSSYSTITTHFKHIYKKLEVHNRGSAIAKALKEHLV